MTKEEIIEEIIKVASYSFALSGCLEYMRGIGFMSYIIKSGNLHRMERLVDAIKEEERELKL